MQNYKVYVNNKEVIFENIQNIPSSDNYIKFEQLPGSSKLDSIIHDFERDEEQLTLEFLSENPRNLFLMFAGSYHLIYAAGGVVRTPEGEMLWIFRNGKWDLPKGKRQRNEKFSTCALREVEEETGLRNLKITNELPQTLHTYMENGKRILKRTFWFEMHADKTQTLTPQTEEGITKVKWIAKSDINRVRRNTYRSIINLLEDYLKENK